MDANVPLSAGAWRGVMGTRETGEGAAEGWLMILGHLIGYFGI